MKEVRLEGDRVYLRSITSEDTERIVKWRNQENVLKYFFYRGDFTKEIHENWLRTRVDTGEVEQFIVVLKENDRPVGSTFLRDIDYNNMKAEYGVFLGEEDARGKGIGKEILELTVKYAFEELGLHRIYARVYETNKPSLFSFLHCGFTKEAVMKDSIWADGSFHDVVLLSRISEDLKK